MLVVGVAISRRNANARAEAWHSLLRDVEGRTGEHLTVRVVGLSSTDPARDHARATSQADEIFAMIARHPLMTINQLARVLRTTNERIERVEAELIERGWVRRLPDHNLPPEVGNHARRWGLVELTSAGRREAARRLYLPPRAASRSHGLLGGRASTRPFLRHLAHTVGANGVFVSFITAARQDAERGVELRWKNGAMEQRVRVAASGRMATAPFDAADHDSDFSWSSIVQPNRRGSTRRNLPRTIAIATQVGQRVITWIFLLFSWSRPATAVKSGLRIRRISRSSVTRPIRCKSS